MQNLAGNPDAARIIADELTRCGIPAIEDPKQSDHPEVKVSVIGSLNGFTFRRNWYYYSVSGLFPLALAKELYEHPVGKSDVRVDGHCACPAPEDPWLTYIAPDGMILCNSKNREIEERAYDTPTLRPYYAEFLKTHRWSDDPAAEGEAFVTTYHVDSELGLYLLAREILRIPPQGALASAAPQAEKD